MGTLARNAAQKMKFSIKDFFSKFDQIRSFLWIWSYFLKKSFIENFIFCTVNWFYEFVFTEPVNYDLISYTYYQFLSN